MIRTTRARRVTALALPFALVAFSACSDDDDAASDDTTADGGSSGGDVESCDVDDGDADPLEGVPFSSPTADYTIVFPTAPQSSQQDSTTADGRTLPVTRHVAVDGTTSYAAAELSIPEGEPYSLEGGRDGSVDAIEGELLCSDDIEIDGRDGVQFIAAVESGGVTGHYVSRILTDGDTVYQMIVVGEGELRPDDDVVAPFFASFTFTS